MSEFFDFLNEIKEEEKQQQMDWEMAKQSWIAELNRFMSDIEQWLKIPEQEGAVTIVRDEVKISEDHLGQYKAPCLELHVGSKKVEIKPIGRLIIGASGRVDIISFAENYIILNDPSKGWKYRNPQEMNRYTSFNEERFAGILKELLYEN